MTSESHPPSLFIAGLERLRFPVAPGKGDRVCELFNITGDRQFVAGLLQPHIEAALGSIEVRSLLNLPLVAWVTSTTVLPIQHDDGKSIQTCSCRSRRSCTICGW